MRDHLGVGFRLELDPLSLELAAQLPEVFDDPVLYDHQPTGTVGVRMGVSLAGLAMRCPASMPDASVARDRRLGQPGRQVAQLPNISPDRDLPFLNHRDPRRI